MNKKTLIFLTVALFGASNLSAAATLKDAVVRAGKCVVFVGDYPEWADGQKMAFGTEALCNALIAPSTYFAARKFLGLKARKEQGASLKDLVKTNTSDVALFVGSSAAALFSLLHVGAAARKGFNSAIHKYYVEKAIAILNTKVAIKEQTLENALKRNAEIDEEKSNLKIKKTELETELQRLNQDINKLKTQLLQANHQVKLAEQVRDVEMNAKLSAESVLADTLKKIKDLEAQLKQANDQMKLAEQVRDVEMNAKLSAESVLADTLKKIQDLETQLKQANDQVEILQKEKVKSLENNGRVDIPRDLAIQYAKLFAQALKACRELNHNEVNTAINEAAQIGLAGQHKAQAIIKFEKAIELYTNMKS